MALCCNVESYKHSTSRPRLAKVQLFPSALVCSSVRCRYGPQDPNTFPTTFYEVHIDAVGIAAHYFVEPGMPINQLYGVWGNLTMGRNRGWGHSNDYLFEPAAQVGPPNRCRLPFSMPWTAAARHHAPHFRTFSILI